MGGRVTSTSGPWSQGAGVRTRHQLGPAVFFLGPLEMGRECCHPQIIRMQDPRLAPPQASRACCPGTQAGWGRQTSSHLAALSPGDLVPLGLSWVETAGKGLPPPGLFGPDAPSLKSSSRDLGPSSGRPHPRHASHPGPAMRQFRGGRGPSPGRAAPSPALLPVFPPLGAPLWNLAEKQICPLGWLCLFVEVRQGDRGGGQKLPHCWEMGVPSLPSSAAGEGGNPARGFPLRSHFQRDDVIQPSFLSLDGSAVPVLLS